MSPSLPCTLFTSPLFTHMYAKSQIIVKETKKKEKLTKSLEAEFQVIVGNCVSDARKIQWKEDKVCVCVCVCVCV